MVGEGQHPVSDDLAGLVPLARHQQHVPGFEAVHGGSDGPPRSAISTAPGAAARMDARMVEGGSERGLSSVTITTSAFSAAMAPISGRLPLSLSPPQPNRHTSRPLA